MIFFWIIKMSLAAPDLFISVHLQFKSKLYGYVKHSGGAALSRKNNNLFIG